MLPACTPQSSTKNLRRKNRPHRQQKKTVTMIFTDSTTVTLKPTHLQDRCSALCILKNPFARTTPVSCRHTDAMMVTTSIKCYPAIINRSCRKFPRIELQAPLFSLLLPSDPARQRVFLIHGGFS
eukprot:Gregarina_sp_Poly_1__2187@NODE_1581_length_3795_cov_120_818938_g311_i2_p5_GENE_NODE_1581_length_3795_cov_120_818938_g311_i2NODE_1581_length_3795_cov_120_818938_g311_i2_p5_ORF_typecomplete_len125_score4_71Endotoxin_C2/PF18449_1/0_21_NODE_1581_length_3795_cov_120_818938_g311_i2146520